MITLVVGNSGGFYLFILPGSFSSTFKWLDFYIFKIKASVRRPFEGSTFCTKKEMWSATGCQMICHFVLPLSSDIVAHDDHGVDFICFRIKICPRCHFCMYNLWPSIAMLRIECDVSYLLVTNCKEKLNGLKIGCDVTQSCGLWRTFPLVRGWEIIMESGSLRVTWLRSGGFMFYTDTTHIPALNSKVNFFSPHYPVIM